MERAVIARELSKYYNHLKAVDGISFEIEENEVFGFLGPNGAGKATTIRCITTLTRPSSGKIEIFGKDTIQNPDEVRQNIGYVPQSLSLVSDISGYENLLISAKLYGVPSSVRKERIEGMFMAIFTGVSLVWEKDLGQLDRSLCAPTPRTSIVLGKALTGGVKGLFQAGIVLVIALVMGVSIIFNPLYIIAVILVVLIFWMCFSSLSIFVMTLLKTRERVMGIVQLITMPLFFTSNALYPIELMPAWLQAISFANPMTYVVAALRALMITGDLSGLPVDLAGMSIATLIFVALASIAFRNIWA